MQVIILIEIEIIFIHRRKEILRILMAIFIRVKIIVIVMKTMKKIIL